MVTPTQVRCIAVPVLAGVGNALMQQPLVRQLAAAYPDAEVTILARGRSIAAVFERLPQVAAVRVYGSTAGAFAKLLRDLRRLRADVLAVPYPSNRWQYSLLAAVGGARTTLINGYAVGYWRAMHFLSPRRVPVVEGAHDVVQALNLLRPLGVEPDVSMRPIFPLTHVERDAATALLTAERQRRSGPASGDISQNADLSGVAARLSDLPLAIHAGSGATVFGAAKRWDPANYAALIRRLNRPVVLLEGPDESGVADEINAAAGVASPVVRLAGPLADAAAVLANCRLYVGNDSGLGHLAAAVGTPPVTLFGPARPDELCPYGHRHLVVQTPAPCAPCFRYPTHAVTPRVACRPPYCVNQITIESVLATIRRALSD